MAKILIVEDDKRTNMAICEYLKPTGHNIVSAYDGEEALQLFHSTTIDLIVLDIMLPRLTGIAVLHEIRKSSLIPVLMLTAIEDEYTQSQSFDERAVILFLWYCLEKESPLFYAAVDKCSL